VCCSPPPAPRSLPGHGRHRKHGHRQRHRAGRTAEPLPGVPPFFAGIITDAGPNGTSADVVKIFPSAKGIPVATVTIPGAPLLFSLARLGDDEHFVVASFDRDSCLSHLWTFAIDAAGLPGPVTPLAALPQLSGGIEELTSSADGTALGFSVQLCAGGLQAGMIHLPTGQITRWDSLPEGFSGNLSLTADGSVLGFTVKPGFEELDSTDQAFTKPADLPAGPLLKGAQEVPGLGVNAIGAVLSPSVISDWIEAQAQPDGPVTLSQITTSTGVLIRQVTQLSEGGDDAGFRRIALDNAGQHMLAYGGHPGPGHADVEEVDLSSGQTRTFAITNPVIDGPITTFAW
jgi:hypothetical protein